MSTKKTPGTANDPVLAAIEVLGRQIEGLDRRMGRMENGQKGLATRMEMRSGFADVRGTSSP
jgi:hypothetical protein